MALDAFGGVMTAQTIVRVARDRAGNPSKHLDPSGTESLDAIAYLEFQAILDSLALDYDWPYARVIRTLSLAEGQRTVQLPHEFWRISFDDPAWILDGCGGRRRIHLDDEGGFFQAISAPGAQVASGTPVRFWIHKQNQALYLEPVPNRGMELEFHFQPWQIPLDAITSKPWFPHSEYLIAALAAKLNLGQDDARAASEDTLAERLLARARNATGDQGDRRAELKLNPTRFRPFPRI